MTHLSIPAPIPHWPGIEITPYQPAGWVDGHLAFDLRPGAPFTGLVL